MAKSYRITTKAEAVKHYRLWKSANTAYHNGDAILLDSDFDALTEALVPWYPDVKTVIGAAIPKNASARKVMLPNPMNSLDKAKPDTIASMAGRLGSKVIVEAKVDGVSLQVTNVKGKKSLFTRGDGRVGQDVSHLIPMLKMGDVPPGYEIRFEAVLSHKAYAKVKTSDKPARGHVAGVINSSKNINAAIAKAATCVAFNIYKPQMSPAEGLATLKRLGWAVPRHVTVRDLSAPALTKLLKDWKASAKYEMDGIVLVKNVYEKPTIGSNPQHSVAFKIDDAAVQVTVTKVVWTPSQYGTLNPVAHFAPTQVGGVSVSKATLHDARNVQTKKIGPGAVISIIRSGDVIPKIVDVVTPAAKAAMPKTGTYKWNGANIESDSDEHDDAIATQRVWAFFSDIGVLGFGSVVADKVSHLDIATIASLTSKDWVRMGVGQADSLKLPPTIKTALEGTTVPRLMAASSVFGRSFGNTKANALWSLTKNDKPKSTKLLAAKIATLPGFSVTSANAIASQWRAWVLFYNALPYKPKATKASKTDLTGKSYVFSEYRDKELENFITANGGTVSSTVSSKTTALFTNPTAKTVKANNARSLNVPIVEPGKARSLVGFTK